MEKIERAKVILGELLSGTLSWGCMDEIVELKHEFEEILGMENMPYWWDDHDDDDSELPVDAGAN